MSTRAPLPSGNEVKYFLVLRTRTGECEKVETLAFEFTAVKAPADGSNHFIISHTPGTGFPSSDYVAPKELWQFFGEIGTKLTLDCTYERGDLAFTFLPKEVVMGCELVSLA